MESKFLENAQIELLRIKRAAVSNLYELLKINERLIEELRWQTPYNQSALNEFIRLQNENDKLKEKIKNVEKKHP